MGTSQAPNSLGSNSNGPGLGSQDGEVQPAFSWEQPEKASHGVWDPGIITGQVAALGVTVIAIDVNGTVGGDSREGSGREGPMYPRKEVDPWFTLLTK